MEQTQRPPKRYPFKYSALALTLFALGLALSAAAFAYATWQLVDFLRGDSSSVYAWMKFALFYLASALLALFLISMLIRSQYVINDTHLVMQLGIIRQKYELSRIYSVHLFRGSGKLAVYFDDFKTDYIIIVVKEAWYEDFVRELTARNEKIAFSFSTPEEEDEIKKK